MIRSFKPSLPETVPLERLWPLLRESEAAPEIPAASADRRCSSTAACSRSNPSLGFELPANPDSTSERWRRSALEELILECASTEVRLIERQEAISLCNALPSQIESGSLLAQLAQRTQTAPEILQRRILKARHQPVVKIAPFLPQLRSGRLPEYLRILGTHRIIPLLRQDRLLTVLAEFPIAHVLVPLLCQENHLPIEWCHVIPVCCRNLRDWLEKSLDASPSEPCASEV